MNAGRQPSLLAAVLLAALAGPTFAEYISIHITDLGINQWSQGLTMGESFGSAFCSVFPEYPDAARILVPMPADDQFAQLSDEHLRDLIAWSVQDRIDRGLAQGVNRFEVRLVQNINTLGYASPHRQTSANRFGRLAYEALGQVDATLRAGGHSTYHYAIAGSNGTKVLTENVSSWRSFLDGADLIDGRAFYTPTVETIVALGAGNVRFFNTRGDWLAPFTKYGMRSIGNFDTVKLIKDRFPGVSSFLVTPRNRDLWIGSGHIAVLTSLEETFSILEYMGGDMIRTPLPWIVSGRHLRPVQNPFSGASASLHRDDSAVHLSDAFAHIHGQLSLLEELAGKPLVHPRLSDVLSFLPSIIQDAESRRQGSLHPLTSYSLEHLGSFVLDKMPDVVTAFQTKGWLSKGFKLPPMYGAPDFVAGAASHVGKGNLGIEEITHYLDGTSKLTAAVLGSLLAGPQGAKIAELVADTAIVKLRRDTMPWIQALANFPVRQQMVARWRTLQERRLANGERALAFDEHFEPALLRKAGFGASTIRRLNRSASRASDLRTAGADLLRELGGVDASIEPVGEAMELEETRRELLRQRPDGQPLTWPLPSAKDHNKGRPPAE